MRIVFYQSLSINAFRHYVFGNVFNKIRWCPINAFPPAFHLTHELLRWPFLINELNSQRVKPRCRFVIRMCLFAAEAATIIWCAQRLVPLISGLCNGPRATSFTVGSVFHLILTLPLLYHQCICILLRTPFADLSLRSSIESEGTSIFTLVSSNL